MNNYYIFYTNNLFSEFEIINSGESFTYKFINNKNLNFTKKFEENDILFICKKKRYIYNSNDFKNYKYR